MTTPLTVLSASKLFSNLLERYLEPLNLSDQVRRILVVRHEPIGTRLSKVENVTFGDGGTALNLARMLRTVEKTIRREPVDWVLGFNPVPWGSVGALAAAVHRVPVSLSFIGSDFKQIMKPQAAPLWLAVRHAKLVTVTGERMRSGLIEHGVPSSKIRILPHAIDTRRFSPDDSVEKDLDVVSVGQLIPRKRMDVLIDAVALLRDRGITIRAGILGNGPLQGELERRIEERRVGDRIEMLGYRNDVEAVLRRARTFALVSDWEGVPFAMIEAMSTGLVPIVTDVGTIADWIKDGQNGRIVPVGDARALADVIDRLKSDSDHYGKLQSAALGMRASLSLESGVAFWKDALGAS
jgi:glycosyltransferase involved in cell wall biosynthesis